MAPMHRIIEKSSNPFFWLILLCHLSFVCAVFPLLADEPAKTAADQAKEQASSVPAASEGVEGRAVYYARRFQGRRTNSGEVFDHNKLTAAHPSLPYGTRVKVMNPANGRSVEVRINDRCRKRSYEIIDLTRRAAQELGFYGKGSARVKIMPLPED